MIYLRKVLEVVTSQTAKSSGISEVTSNGRKRTFRDLLQQVDEQHSIIPQKFSAHGYTLFKELSDVIHGSYEEADALKKYPPCRELILGIVRNVAMNSSMASAVLALGWETEAVVELVSEVKVS